MSLKQDWNKSGTEEKFPPTNSWDFKARTLKKSVILPKEEFGGRCYRQGDQEDVGKFQNNRGLYHNP